ncbi:hypothetical protein DET54_106223 [Paenibacillus pabuli]|uniref:Minor structural protein GP20 n=1 Tax=Paenibacillus pabuli TaxID=1472 RepID=A0ABX9BK89_9BACL|nr:hypothetical protein [Paenibacillus pabuli]RAI96865.1 hypothetical protein DET54_106223 [Paenibacillus pabuli]
MTDINTHIQYATNMIHGDTTVSISKDIFDIVKNDVKEIQEDKTLSPMGKIQKEDEARKRGAYHLANMLNANQNMVNAELHAAETKANKILAQLPPTPPDTELHQFNEKYAELKANLQVHANARAAGQLLEFMRGVNDPYLANLLTQDYAELGGALIKHTKNPIGVNTIYGTLRSARDTAEQTQARVALKEIAQLRQTRSYNSLLELGADKALGPIGRSAMNDPAGFIQANEGSA